MNLLDQLQQLAPLAAQATAGPWAVPSDRVLVYDANKWAVADTLCRYLSVDTMEANAAFIAAARNLLTPENLRIIRSCVKVVMDSRPA